MEAAPTPHQVEEVEAPRIIGEGKKDGFRCSGCGEWVVPKYEEYGWLKWYRDNHHCVTRASRELERRLARHRAEQSRWKNPPGFVASNIKRLVRLPHWCPDGLDGIRAEECTPRQAKALEIAMAHREQWQAGKPPTKGLWIVGDTGRRKTLILAALAFDVALRTEKPVAFWSLQDLLEEKRNSFSGDGKFDDAGVAHARMLVLDDIGSYRPTEWTWDFMFGIFNHAYTATTGSRKAQVLYSASNETPDQIARKFVIHSDQSTSDRMMRRLYAETDVFYV